jgi:hypothetical protein
MEFKEAWDGDERPIALRPEPAASAAAPPSKAAASDASGGAAVVEEPKASEPNYSGLIHKGGRHVRTNWKPRYFEIQGSEVRYYVRKGDDEPKGHIPLRGGECGGARLGIRRRDAQERAVPSPRPHSSGAEEVGARVEKDHRTGHIAPSPHIRGAASRILI